MIDEKLSKHVAMIKEGYAQEREFFTGYKKYFPSRTACISLVHDIRHLLFPGFFDNETAAGESSDYLISERLLHISRVLNDQVFRALLFDDESLGEEGARKKASEIADNFIDNLGKIQSLVLKDIQAAFDGDPAARCLEEVLLAYPGVFAIFVYRISHELYTLDVPLIPRLISEYAHGETGIDIGPATQVGEYFFIDHGTGVVIGETTIIGDHVKIYQGVTLGATSTRGGQNLAGVKRHPTLGNDVTVYSNASVLGGETIIGDGAVIGGNAFVAESVPENARVSVKDQSVSVTVREPK